MNPIQPDLAPLARAAKAFSKEFRLTGGGLAGADRRAARGGRQAAPAGCGASTVSATRRATCGTSLYVDPDDDFVITAITWLPGQKSPVHGHYVWCAYGVAEGEFTEEQFRAPGALLEPLRHERVRAGELAELDLGGPLYHRVSNRTRQPLVTLHVYGVAADRLTTGINRIYAKNEGRRRRVAPARWPPWRPRSAAPRSPSQWSCSAASRG